jgi:A/G-specific adenine glycosylase
MAIAAGAMTWQCRAMARTTSTAAPLPQIKPAMLRTFHTRLLAWYTAHGRHHLPWRNTDDAYPIWLSEVMLQQTQVATVLTRFYVPFLDRFPTIEALASASHTAVMKAWEGLGYYRRAGFLHDAAQQMVQAAHHARRNDSVTLPTDYEALRALPGIGKNTAHAILAFAHRQPVAILEANVKRIVARIFAWESPSDAQLWAGADALLNQREPFDYNQAMMDLGSMICTPKKPDCTSCPANGICLGQSAPESYPAPRTKKQVPVREVTILVTEDAAGKFYLEVRKAALLGGLYGFAQEPRAHGKTQSRKIGIVTHTYSHFKLIGHVLHTKLSTTGRGPNWHSRAHIAMLPLSGIDHKVLALIDIGHSGEKKPAKPVVHRARH